jgi:uncharacterized damage-inducible protein DinB
MFIRDTLLPEFDHEAATTRKVLERVPEDKFGWKPHPKSWDAATLASHVANIPSWVGETLNRDSLDLAATDGPKPEPAATSRQELLDRFDRNIAAARAALAAAENEQFMQPWSLKNGEQTVFTLPKAAVIRSWVFNHSVHHRAQLAMYLRLNDVPVPAIYGPSADEQPF